VGRFFGVPLYFAPSWILIAALITVTYGGVVYEAVDGLSRSVSYLVALAFAVALALCVMLHELGHVGVSLALGRPVRRATAIIRPNPRPLARESLSLAHARIDAALRSFAQDPPKSARHRMPAEAILTGAR